MQSTSEADSFYTREEVIAARGTVPTRGLWCKKCSTWIPQFADLSDEDEWRVRHAAGRFLAIQELIAATGCDRSWAKVWVGHWGRPDVFYNTRCPYCGQEVRSSEAKQCRHCKRDWHDPNKILILGTSERFIEEP